MDDDLDFEFDDFDDADDELLSQVNVDYQNRTDRDRLNPPIDNPINTSEREDVQFLGKRTANDPVNSGLNNSKLMILDTSTTKTPKKLTTRRFPGPAGILPTLKPSEFKSLDKSRSILSPVPPSEKP